MMITAKPSIVIVSAYSLHVFFSLQKLARKHADMACFEGTGDGKYVLHSSKVGNVTSEKSWGKGILV